MMCIVILAMGPVACSDDDDGIILDDHDNNKMMQLMHQNMDSHE